MNELIRYEAMLLLLSICTGAWLMLFYDVLRVFRLLIRHGVLWTGLEDFFYWMVSGLVTFMLLYEQNDGKLRAYVIFGVLAGMAAYDRLLGRLLWKHLQKIEKAIKIEAEKQAGERDI